MNRFAAAAIAAIIASPLSAQSAFPKEIGVYKDWAVFKDELAKPGAAPTCWAVTEPTEATFTRNGKPLKDAERDDARLFATYQPEVDGQAVFSYLAGFPMDPAKPASVNAKSSRFPLAVGSNMAWVYADDDAAAFTAMKKARVATVETMSLRGTSVTDTFSLMGVSAAIRAMIAACQPPVEESVDVVASQAPADLDGDETPAEDE